MNKKPERTRFIKPELGVEELSTALYHTNQKLEKANKELLQSQKELTEIYVNISHDLRSPITSIRNSIDYMTSLDLLDTKELMDTIKLINNKVNYLEHLINDMFLLSVINSTKKAIENETVNIGIFLEEFFFSCDADSRYAKRNLYLKVPENFPYLVSADCHMLLRVLDNLFTNALKYSQEGASITLSADRIENNVLISVSDTGIGIAKEHLTKIFNRTYMVAAARTPGMMSGCGLGLTIAKAIVENHNGRIWCESEYGKGSSFRFTLPTARLSDTAV